MTARWPSDRYVFITGCPRSGTSVLKKVLREHPQMTTVGIEHAYILDLVDKFGSCAPSVSAALDELENHPWGFGSGETPRTADAWGQPLEQSISWIDFFPRLHAFHAPPQESSVLLLQYPGPGILRWRELNDLFPGAAFVSLERDPRANVSSQLAAFNKKRSTSRSIRLWKQCLRAAAEAEPRVRLQRVIYEDLVTESATSLEAICDFVGVTYSSDLLSFEVLMPDISADRSVEFRSFRSFDPTLSQKWKRGLHPSQIWLIETLTRTEMADNGYITSGTRFRISFAPRLLMDLFALALDWSRNKLPLNRRR